MCRPPAYSGFQCTACAAAFTPPPPPLRRGESRRRLAFFSPLAKGGHRGVLRVPLCSPSAPGSASRSLKTALGKIQQILATHSPTGNDRGPKVSLGVSMTSPRNASSLLQTPDLSRRMAPDRISHVFPTSRGRAFRPFRYPGTRRGIDGEPEIVGARRGALQADRMTPSGGRGSVRAGVGRAARTEPRLPNLFKKLGPLRESKKRAKEAHYGSFGIKSGCPFGPPVPVHVKIVRCQNATWMIGGGSFGA